MAQSIGMGGSGAASFLFKEVGDTVEGTILDLEEKEIQDIDTGEVVTWPNGNPKMQIVAMLATDLAEGEGINPEKFSGVDDGQRTIWIKGHLYTAVREAVKAAGQASIEVGGKLKVRFDGLGEKKKAAYSAPKLYKARYSVPPPAAVSMASDDSDF